MPELPEVETSRRRIERVLKGKRLVEVMPDPDDRIVYDRQSPDEVREALEGARVVGTGRKGKYFWLKLDRKPWPVFHLGMTGNVEIRSSKKGFTKAWGGHSLWSEPKRDGLPPKFLPFARLRMTAENGVEIAITDPRRFGRIRLAEDPEAEKPVSALGYDPLLDFPTAKKLHEILVRRRAPLKAVLLDQGLFAGVGNWIADEVLFQSRLSPKRPATKLSLAETTRLRSKLLAIVKKSVAVDADYDRYPKSWLFHHRWGKVAGSMTSRKHPIVHDTIGGRTTAWVPALQK